MLEDLTSLTPALGGALIGLAASALLLFEGRIAGISGIVGGLFAPKAGDIAWRAAFVAGLVAAGLAAAQLAPYSVSADPGRSPWLLVPAGMLVGFGTRLGNGCTSGHGVCGLSRLSRRSLASVITFMATGALVATLTGRLLGGVG